MNKRPQDPTTDRRTLFATERVAATELRGQVRAPRYADPVTQSVIRSTTFLCAAPAGGRDRQLVYGDRFDVLEEREGWRFGRARRDGYVGWVAAGDLGRDAIPTHRVALRHTHLYPAPSIKLPPLARRPFGAGARVERDSGGWARTDEGWLRSAHLRPEDQPLDDPVAVAEMFIGTPYLWAGNTGDGIDCSGLVQVACLACGIACPGDSDQQEAALGVPLAAEDTPRRGDLLFWKGHVAWVAGFDLLLHANAHAMAVTFEALGAAVRRIEAQGDGPVTSRRRL